MADKNNYIIGEYIIYVNGEQYEIGRIKSITKDGAFICYHEGETAAKTPFDCMHKIINEYCISETTLGGSIWASSKPTEQKIGEWIITSEFNDCQYMRCNQCKHSYVYYFCTKYIPKYCPNCGAKMKIKQ